MRTNAQWGNRVFHHGEKLGMGRRCSHANLHHCTHLGGGENLRFVEKLRMYGRNGHGTCQYQREIVSQMWILQALI